MDQRGTTLVELLTSTLFLSILMGMSYGFARAALMSSRVQEVKSEAQEVTVMAQDILVRELRMTGCGLPGQPLVGVQAAAEDHVEVASDLNGDGDTADSDEIIAYSYDDAKHALMRATAGAAPQPLVRNVPAHGVHFSFLDADGHEILPGAQGVSPSDRRRIRRIDLLLHVELPNPDPLAGAVLESTISSSVFLRNG